MDWPLAPGQWPGGLALDEKNWWKMHPPDKIITGACVEKFQSSSWCIFGRNFQRKRPASIASRAKPRRNMKHNWTKLWFLPFHPQCSQRNCWTQNEISNWPWPRLTDSHEIGYNQCHCCAMWTYTIAWPPSSQTPLRGASLFTCI